MQEDFSHYVLSNLIAGNFPVKVSDLRRYICLVILSNLKIKLLVELHLLFFKFIFVIKDNVQKQY